MMATTKKLAGVIFWLLVLNASAQATGWEQLSQQALQLYHGGQLEPALVAADQALQLAERSGAEDLSVAGCLNNLAALHTYLGDYPRAEALHARAQQLREQTLDEEHPQLAITLNNLAAAHLYQRHIPQAEALLQRALQILEETGRDHPLALAAVLNNLAEANRAQRAFANAEQLYKRSLTIKDRLLGTDHPDYQATLNNLAALYRAQGRTGEAAQLTGTVQAPAALFAGWQAQRRSR